MGICASKDATTIVETRESNVDLNGVELKESNPNELLVGKVPSNLMPTGTNDGDGVEEAGHTENVLVSRVPASSNRILSSCRLHTDILGHFRQSFWICCSAAAVKCYCLVKATATPTVLKRS